MKLYLSSTYMDLKSHRATLARALRAAGYEVVIGRQTSFVALVRRERSKES